MANNAKNLDLQIIQYIKLIDKKWRIAILNFKSKIKNLKYNKNNTKKAIRSSIYGDIIIDDKEKVLIDSFYLQRQRDILHKGFAYYIYPEARHSRFEHSLGVFWIIKRLFESPFWASNKIDEKDRLNLICAALLHDIGHGPFSHFTEYLLDYLNITSVLRPKGLTSFNSRYHERKAVSMILNKDYLLKKIGLDSYYLDEALQELGANPDSVSKMILGDKNEKLSSLINGPIDADKLDYYQRDSFFTGTPAGTIDAEFLMRNVKFNDKKIFFLEKTFSSIIQMFYNREYVYSITSYHPVMRVIQSMMVVAFMNALSFLSPETQVEVILSLDMMNDNDFWAILDIISSYLPDKDKRGGIVINMLHRFYARDFYKRWFMLSLDECNKLKIHIFSKEKNKYSPFYPLKYTQENMLTGKLNKNEVIIFEIYPNPKPRDERKEKIIENYKNIYIEDRRGNIMTFYERLGKDKNVIIDGLTSFQHQLNNVLLIHPIKKEKDLIKIPMKLINYLELKTGGFSAGVRDELIKKLDSLETI